jgi:hypothetical protein
MVGYRPSIMPRKPTAPKLNFPTPNLPQQTSLPPILSDSSFKQFEPGKAKDAADQSLMLNEKRGHNTMNVNKRII